PRVQDNALADPLTVQVPLMKLFGIAGALALLGLPARGLPDTPTLLLVGRDDTVGGPRSVHRLAAAYRRRARFTDVTTHVTDGRLSEFALAGDFFLEPDEALLDINRAIVGLPDTTDVQAIAAAIRHNLPVGAQLLGFTPEAVGIAVRRALITASTWSDFEWEIVDDPAVSPHMNLALDEVLTERVGAGLRKPTLRIWEWDRS